MIEGYSKHELGTINNPVVHSPPTQPPQKHMLYYSPISP